MAGAAPRDRSGDLPQRPSVISQRRFANLGNRLSTFRAEGVDLCSARAMSHDAGGSDEIGSRSNSRRLGCLCRLETRSISGSTMLERELLSDQGPGLVGRNGRWLMNIKRTHREASVRVLGMITFVVACAGCPESSSDSKGAGGTSNKNSGQTNSGTSNTGVSGAKACARISASEVSSVLGISQLMDPTADVNDIVTICQYGQGNNPVKVQIRYQAPTTPSEFARGKKAFTDNGFTTSDVSGIGDMAYSSSTQNVNTLDFLSSSTEVTLVAAASLDKLEALAKELISKL
jgi:hypothetical protein